MRILLLLLVCCILPAAVSLAQNGTDTIVPRQDSGVIKKDTVTPVVKKDSTKKDTTVKNTVTRIVPAVKDTNAPVAANKNDSLTPPPIRDTAGRPVDTIAGQSESDTDATGRYTMQGFMAVLKDHPYFNFFSKPVLLMVKEKKSDSKDALFYFMSGLLIYYGLVRLFFGRYISNLLALFFRATMRQQQIRDQLMQSPFPSLLLNFLFLVTGGLFLTFVLINYGLSPIQNVWLLLPWCSALLLVIYTGKLLLLKITGWIFNVAPATDTYIFIVFLVNKMIGMVLLPVLVIMAFADPPLFNVMLTLTFLMLFFFLVYRFLISYAPIRNELKVNRFHFFLYLCAFEIAPLLLIYKVLLIFLERSH